MGAITLYGLTKCSTCQKAVAWLQRAGVEHRFVDYREHPVPAATLKHWAGAVGGFEKLVNRTGMTWRNLPDARKKPGSDAEWTLLIREYPALVRRPVAVAEDGEISLGFSDALFKRRFAA
ncbi:Spx/MgsR family RNA polymerase-binding regulatory protein [Dokdonella koreensis]|uniref:Arsenate reductase and related protein, glutaredoxin family n=1 Tax=Dokdonella koreensis DS-123 TaxID=1300342 RepID=A0A161HR82_9GAMM|nr:Spx/MgsR family RNA polymerase-binding regulatory protein [Dokdonella koreensis]ANB17972.1 Arsenate reductase and related protein, glutaredoxin family [Dokdonella koreensis DS-123]